MGEAKSYFFCGIGGSGMLPLALIVRARGDKVAGSDRTLDQGRLAAKFDFLRRRGIALFPQDGSGITGADQIVVASAAVEENVPDMVKASALGARRSGARNCWRSCSTPPDRHRGRRHQRQVDRHRHDRLDPARAGRDPTVMNGAVMKNFVTPTRPSPARWSARATSSSARSTKATARSRSTGPTSPC